MQPATQPKSNPPANMMARHDLPSAFDLFGLSWEAFKLNLGTFILGFIVPVLLLVVPAILATFGAYHMASHSSETGVSPGSVTVANVFLVILGILGVLAVAFFFYPFLYYLKLQSAKGRKMSFSKNLQESRPFIWRLLGLMILRGLIIGVGFLLLIVPGFFMWKRYMLAPYYLLDKNLGVGEALKQSAADSKPFSSAIWGMIGVYILITLSGIIPIAGYILEPVLAITYCCAQAIRFLQVQGAKAK